MKTTNLRIPDEIYKAIKESSENNRRSMNSEIVVALELYISNFAKISLGTSVSMMIDSLKNTKQDKGQ